MVLQHSAQRLRCVCAVGQASSTFSPVARWAVKRNTLMHVTQALRLELEELVRQLSVLADEQRMYGRLRARHRTERQLQLQLQQQRQHPGVAQEGSGCGVAGVQGSDKDPASTHLPSLCVDAEDVQKLLKRATDASSRCVTVTSNA